ncbi:MAG: molybdate ABC transporter substrate-binding protein [Nocardioides sp.]|jgi:molybdate transport system substrate-binding protein
MKKCVAAAALLALLPLSGCGGSEETRTLHVLAAASLTETFTELARDFEEAHEGVTVKLVFDSSATLAQQAVDGAPGDVLATADETTMDTAKQGEALGSDPTVFATNVLTLVTPADNPSHITSLADLAGTDWVECVETAPCGKVADAVLSAQEISAAPASREVDVKAVLAKVTEGEADAGLVYATDAVAAGDAVQTIAIEGAQDQQTTYPIATLNQSKDDDLAQGFVDLVTGTSGRQVLARAGFGTP